MHLLWTKKNFNFCTCNKQWFNCNQYLTNTCSVHYGPLLSRSWSNIHNMHCTYFTRKQWNLITMYMYLDLQLKNQCSQWVQISSMLIILISFFGRHFTAGDRHWISIFYIQMTILPQQQTTILSYSFRSVYWRCNILTEAPEIAEIEESIGAK